MNSDEPSENKDLRVVGRSEDGNHLELTDNGGATYTVRISDSLRATVNQAKLAAVLDQTPEVMTIKEIQARLRAGERADEISRIGNVSMEKIERFSGPIMQERAYIVDLAQKTPLRKDSQSQTLAELVLHRLAPRGVDMNLVNWNTARSEDGSWKINLDYPNRDGAGTATWSFDAARKTLTSDDEGARWIGGEESLAKPAPRNDHGMIFPTGDTSNSDRQAPRLVSVRTDPMQDENNPIEAPTAPALQETLDIEPEAKRDGVKRRISIPSWDDIMFGSKRDKEEVEEEE